MSYGQRPGHNEGFDFVALLAIGILIVAAAHVTGLTRGLQLDLPGRLPTLLSWQPAISDPELPPRDRNHRVRRGETLSRLARRYGVPMARLAAHNGLEQPYAVQVGQVLTIPPRKRAGRSAPAAPSPAAARPATRVAAQPAPSVSAPPAPDPALITIDELLALVEADVRAARFDDALHAARTASRLLDAHAQAAAERVRRARIEIALGTVHTALGNEEEARQRFERALEADPALALDPTDTSPKVLRTLEAVRESRHHS